LRSLGKGLKIINCQWLEPIGGLELIARLSPARLPMQVPSPAHQSGSIRHGRPFPCTSIHHDEGLPVEVPIVIRSE
jgi:hypothetical protein